MKRSRFTEEQIVAMLREVDRSRHRAHRLWRLAGLQLPRRRLRRRVATSRPRSLPAAGTNHLWAYAFVFDACASGQQIKCLTVIETWRRHYNHGRPHSSLKDLTSIEFKTRYDGVNQGGAITESCVRM